MIIYKDNKSYNIKNYTIFYSFDLPLKKEKKGKETLSFVHTHQWAKTPLTISFLLVKLFRIRSDS